MNNYVIQILNEHGAELIGSRALGVAKANSDYDFIITEREFKKVKKFFDLEPISNKIYDGAFFKPGYEFKYNNDVFHVIVLCTGDWLKWHYTIQAMKTLPSYYYNTKAKRVCLFEGMVKLLGKVVI